VVIKMELPEKVIGTDVLYEFLCRKRSRRELSDYVKQRTAKKRERN
jgi:hypothetical protein